MGFALGEHQLWRGMKRRTLAQHFGLPGAIDGSRDIWYTNRKWLLWRLRNEEEPPRWEHNWYDWNFCMIAEYDDAERLDKLLQSSWPGEVVVQGSPGAVPFQCTVFIPEDADIPPVPPEWTEALQHNSHVLEAAASNSQ